MDADVRRFATGLVGFGFVALWVTTGFLAAAGAVAAYVALVEGPSIVNSATKKRKKPPRRREIRSRPLADELPLVPDEPSLVLELG